MTGQRVTKKAFDNLELGYSCMCKKIERNEEGKLVGAYEVFKYATKAFTSDQTAKMIDLEQFQTLKSVYARERLIEGYGMLRNFQETTEFVPNNTADTIYQAITTQLKQIEPPTSTSQVFNNVFTDFFCERPNWRYISKREIYALDPEYLKTLTPDNMDELLAKLELNRKLLSRLHTLDRETATLQRFIDRVLRDREKGNDLYTADLVSTRAKIRNIETETKRIEKSHPDIYRTFRQRKGSVDALGGGDDELPF